ncbi:MAG: amidohydrolase [Pseudomonadota bacterium]|nr:amidohydrolase [Pseudomonadota bacterium]
MIRTTIALIAALAASPAIADTLIDNANGIQVGADGKLQSFNGLLIDDDGKLVRVLGPADARPIAKVRVDAGGRTLLPGLIDAHGHVMGLGIAAIQLDLVGTTSLQELQSRLGRYAADNPNAQWVVGRGWNQENWPDKRFPTAADLDAVAPNRPVALERVDGHATVVNSAALRAAGITRDTRDPTGGKIERDAQGNPTGLLIDAASALVTAKIPATSPAERDRALAEAQRILLANGLTGVADMGTSREDWAAMQRMGRAGRLQVRIMSYAAGVGEMPAGPSEWLYGDRLRMGGVKLYADGALGSRGAYLKQPYADAPDTRGLRFLTDAELRQQIGQASSRGLQLAVHAIGDAGNDQVISAYEQLGARTGDRRWRIEHVQILDPTDLPRMARSNIIASMQPTHQTSDRLMAEARLGPNRLRGAYAWQSLAQSGARLAFGSDFPVESPNPFPGLMAAVSREDLQGQPPGGWLPHERVSFPQALAGFTRDAAYAGFAEQKFGSLEPGKWADFIIVDRDVSAVDPQSLGRTQVIETWVAGRKAWEQAASVPGERG